MSAAVAVSELVAPLTTAAILSTTAEGDVESVTGNPKSEEMALSNATIVSNITEGTEREQFVVDFDGSDDSSNPLNWSNPRKWALVILLSTVNIIGNLATVMCISAVPQILQEFGSTNMSYQTILVSAWELGEAIGPSLTAPFSEITGRAPVYNATNIIFIVSSIACAVSSNLPMLVAYRLINGIGDASIALNPSIVGDMFIQEERGLPLAMVSLPPLIGPVAGPVIGGYLTQTQGWRWAFWLSAICGGVCELGCLAFFRESYRPSILKNKARVLRRKSGNPQYRSKYDTGKPETSWHLLRHSFIRPGRMLVQSPIIALLAIYVSVVYGFLYILLTTITEVFETVYNFTQGEAGLAYLGLSLGMVAGVLLYAVTSDWWLKRQAAAHSGQMKPEYRLPPMVLGGVLIPAGLLLYGWTAQYRVFFIVPMLGTATLGFGFFVTTIPLNAYLVDAYKLYAASAIAVTIVMRCIVGAVLPLAGPPLYQALGYGWGNGVLALVALVFVPVPVLFMRFGERIRKGGKIDIAD